MGQQVVRRYIVSVDTTGSAGSATGTGYSKAVSGFLVGVYLDFHASSPATTDTTVADVATGRSLMVKSNSATDAMFVPEIQAVDSAASAITGVYGYQPIDGEISVALAQCDALTAAVVATLYILEG